MEFRQTPLASGSFRPSHGTATGFLRFAVGFWAKCNSGTAWLLGATVLSLLLLNLAVNIALNRWHRWFFDMLERRDGSMLLAAVGALFVLIVVGAAFAVAMAKCRMSLQLEWRRWATTKLLDQWAGQSPAGLSIVAGQNHGSPEYRVVEDVRLALDPIVELSVGLANAVILGITFVGILISVGGSLRIDVLGTSVTVPGYLAITAVAYALLASTSMHFIGKPLIRRIAEKNEAEALFLFELTRHAESEVLGKPQPRASLAQATAAFGVVMQRWARVVREHCRLTWLTNSSSFFAPILPLLLAAPKYIEGELSLGAVMQTAAAFTVVLGALNWFTDNYVRIAEWSASARRVDELRQELTREARGGCP